MSREAAGRARGGSRGPAGGRGGLLAALFVCCLAACLAYAPSLGNGFAYDDESIIVDNPVVRSPAGPGQILTTPYWGSRKTGGLYRPLTVATYAAQHALHGLAPSGYHLVNVLLHAAVSALLLLVALEWLGLPAAFAVALLFAVHPLHSEAVANVVGRAELLAAFGVLLAWWWEPAGAPGARGAAAGVGAPWARRVGAALAFGVGLFSKEVALAWLGVALLLALVRRRRPDGATWVLYGVVTAVYLALRLRVLGALGNPRELELFRLDNVIATLPFLAGLWTALGVFGRYMTLLVAPWRLSADYSWPAIPAAGAGEPWAWVGLALALGLLALFAVALARARAGAERPAAPGAADAGTGGAAFPWAALAVGLGCFALAFFPVSNFALRIGTVMAERVLYLPSAGFLIAVGAAGQWAWAGARGARRSALIGALALLALAGAARCWTRSLDWRDNLTIQTATARDMPNSARARYNVGAQWLKQGQAERALPYFRQTVALDSTYTEAWVDLGGILTGAGQFDEGRSALEHALRSDPEWYSALVSLGGLELRAGRPAAALAPLERATRVEPGFPEGFYNLGLARLALGDTLAGVDALRAAARLAPGDADVLNNLAWYLATAPAFRDAREEAVAAARAAVALRPDGNTWDTLAEALACAGHTAEALDACRRALAAGVGDPAVTRARAARLQSGRATPE